MHMVFLVQKHTHAQLCARQKKVTNEHDEPTAIKKTDENARFTSASFSNVWKPEITINAVATQPATKMSANQSRHRNKILQLT